MALEVDYFFHDICQTIGRGVALSKCDRTKFVHVTCSFNTGPPSKSFVATDAELLYEQRNYQSHTKTSLYLVCRADLHSQRYSTCTQDYRNTGFMGEKLIKSESQCILVGITSQLDVCVRVCVYVCVYACVCVYVCVCMCVCVYV